MNASVCPHCGQSHRPGARFCNVTGKAIQPPVGTVSPADAPTGMTGKLPPNHFLHGRYSILRKIGHGGMAAVYQAADTSHPGMLWAIKEMSDAAILAPEEREYAVKAFLQEANLLRSLSHPNLPQVAEVFSEGGKYYLVMEFVQGHTLQELINSRAKPFSEAEILPWAMQLCDVLAYLHTQIPKIIFRDLKPSNIMVTDQGKIKLIDFGIVRFFKPGKSKDTMALWTPGFASPEALSGQTDERSDVFSLCVTLHHLLTLHDPVSTLFNLPPIRKLNPEISPELEQIIIRGVQNEREKRWKNVPQMQIELMKMESGKPGQPIKTSGARMVSSVPGTIVAGLHGQPITYETTESEISPPSHFRIEPTRVAPPGEDESRTRAQAAPPTRAARPTMRLVMTAARLSAKQFTFLILLAVVGIITLTWLLAPLLDELPVNWNNIPLIAVFGAFGYAAYPKRGMAFISHTVLSIVLVGTIWLKLGTQTYDWLYLFLGAVLSGVFMETWAAIFPIIKGDRGDEFWRGEALWLTAMAVIGSVIFFEIVTLGYTGLEPIQLIISAILGFIGWFGGDFLRQFLYYRKIGIRRGG